MIPHQSHCKKKIVSHKNADSSRVAQCSSAIQQDIPYRSGLTCGLL